MQILYLCGSSFFEVSLKDNRELTITYKSDKINIIVLLCAIMCKEKNNGFN